MGRVVIFAMLGLVLAGSVLWFMGVFPPSTGSDQSEQLGTPVKPAVSNNRPNPLSNVPHFASANDK